MAEQKQLFKKPLTAGLVCLAMMASLMPAGYAQEIKEQTTGLYRDVFDQNFYYEGTQLLRLNRVYRLLLGKKLRAGNVNLFDEVADSEFFTNRHAKKRLNAQELNLGPHESDGPVGQMSIYKGKTSGLHPGFFVKDSQGEKYLLKFDNYDNLEMMTGAEVIGSRMYYAIGYHVPQYTIKNFSDGDLVVGANAMTRDDTGFKKMLTPEMLQESMMFLPRTDSGAYRASASKILKGDAKGYWSFLTKRKNDPADGVDHQDIREVRALQVFSSWINNYDVRESNTLDVVIDENGKKVVRHYLIDFSAAFGSAAKGPKPPMFTHEYMFDFGQTFKAFATLGLLEKPWQRRWREAQEQNLTYSPALGYFDNRYFDPGKFKLQLPYYSFKNLSKADAFWASKIIASFTNEDIRAMVEAGKFSDKSDEAALVNILSERRDIIAKYWFEKSNPLDNFDYENKVLTFDDLSVKHGYVSGEGNEYIFNVIAKDGDKGKELTQVVSKTPKLEIQSSWFGNAPQIDILIRTQRKGGSKKSAYVLVELTPQALVGIIHED